jgi:pyruvate formate lyase activating enzyme
MRNPKFFYAKGKPAEELKGTVINMQRFAMHDGPGIRTLVYLKGCPLRCLWCSTPHSQLRGFEILHDQNKCLQSGDCVEICEAQAITLSEEGIKINRDRCTKCRECVTACPNLALEMAGNYMTVDELFHEINKDSPFYKTSNGGVTVGGGEATMQHEFLTAFFKKCKEHEIHTAIETCGYVKWENLAMILEHLDLVHFDIKHMNSVTHKELTDVPNELILDNARKTAALRPIIIRIPVIPGCNDSEENIAATARFAAELGDNFIHLELMPYHNLGSHTFSKLDRPYELSHLEPPSDEHMNHLKMVVESCGVSAHIH